MANKISFRCYFDNSGLANTHYRRMEIEDIPKWLEAYKYTHPEVSAVSVMVWYGKEGQENADGE